MLKFYLKVNAPPAAEVIVDGAIKVLV